MADTRPVFFFDVDNCLYPKSKRVHDLMGDLIDKYFQSHLAVSRKEANELHTRYYKDYGLAIEGLVRHHKVDPMEYNRQVDDALPLEDVLEPNPTLRQLLEDLDTTKVKPWLFTNAYITHGMRVVSLLGVDDLFEGITYCDYGAHPFLCKPSPDMFKKAMREAGAKNVKNCYFVGKRIARYSSRLNIEIDLHVADDSAINATGAQKMGWTAVHLVEPDATAPVQPASQHQISDLEQLRDLFPEFFKSP